MSSVFSSEAFIDLITLIFPASFTLFYKIILAIDFFNESISPSIPYFSILYVTAASAFLYCRSKHSFPSLAFTNLVLFSFYSLYYLSNSSFSTKFSNFISLLNAVTVFYSISAKLFYISAVGSITTAEDIESYFSFSRDYFLILTTSSSIPPWLSFFAIRVA